MDLKIEQWPIDKLVPYIRNPRKNDAAVSKMAGLIKEFGFKVPVVARSDGEVIDGHLRLKAARQLGLETVPVVLADEWTAAQVKAFRLAVNKSAEWAEWDEELLKLELDDLKLEDFDLELIGFDDVVLDDEGGETTTSKANGSLAERFCIPPFSVFDTRSGDWQNRKRHWESLGIQSELGRGGDALENI